MVEYYYHPVLGLQYFCEVYYNPYPETRRERRARKRAALKRANCYNYGA